MLLSSAYAIAGRLPDHMRRTQEREDENIVRGEKLRPVGKEENLIKEAGRSTIEMDSKG
ncbi:unnamed protein product [Prunus armeniaca]|uniref:Uncharacterized protein n=1 Tax=Prunus armeniaca TaxID=36596 RepID=A0A6J5WPE0_PRUAR|nr:unnamed protein product [Prunus armeniaca]